MGRLTRQKRTIRRAFTGKRRVKAERMAASRRNGSDSAVVAHEGPRFVSRDGMGASRHGGSKGCVRTTPGHHLRVQPKQTGRRIFQPNEAAAGGNKRQEFPATDVDKGGSGQLRSLRRRQVLFAARMGDRTDWRGTTGEQTTTRKS